MNPESEAASQAVNQVVRIVGEGLDIALRLTGAAAKETAILLYTVLKSQDEKNKPGRQKLTKVLRTGTAKVFDVPESKMKEFVQEAKRYGISYCVLRKSKNGDKDMHEVIVHEEDAGRISRIADRIQAVTVETVPKAQAKEVPPMTEEDLLNGLLSENPEPGVAKDSATPTAADMSRETASESRPGSWEIVPETGSDVLEQSGDDLFFGMEGAAPQESTAPFLGSTPADPGRTQPDSLDALGLAMFSREGTVQDAGSQPEEAENPTASRTQQEGFPSGRSSRSSRHSSLEENSRSERPSVREELARIRKEQTGAGMAPANEAVHQSQSAMPKAVPGKGR